jgi:hypothetical protein
VKCRKNLQYFAEYGQKQHEELLRRQEQTQEVHDQLMESSKKILSAQVCNFLLAIVFECLFDVHMYP